METTQAKLNKLIETKNAIRQKLISLGIDVPLDTPFEDYSELIKQLGDVQFIETTVDQDLLQLLDLYRWLSTSEYVDYMYTDDEIQRVHNMLDVINDGEQEEIIDVLPVLVITSFGKTQYYVDDIFDFANYTVKIVYPDNTALDVTSQCTYSPSAELTVDDKNITITYVVDDVEYNVLLPIRVKEYIPPLTVTRDVLNQGKFYNVTPTYLTNQINGSDGFTIVGRNSGSSGSAKHSGNLRWTISLDLTDWDTITFYAKKNNNHGMIIVGTEDSAGVSLTGLLYIHYNDGPSSWTEYKVDISGYRGIHTLYFIGGYTDSTGNTSSSTSYCNIIFS